jgi:hypothetical protein
MNIITNIVLTLIFACISIVHLYWAFGGNWGKKEAIPTTKTGAPLFNPGFLDCFVVAMGLICFILLINFGHLDFIPQKVNKVIVIVIALIFLIRAIGDFKYVGFFKKIKESMFARMDSKYYSPLCFVIFMLLVLKLGNM